MSENTNDAAATAAAKHRGNSTEGTVRVLGQTAAVAGISGALLLALKAMVLVSPAVLPDQDGLDALGRPNAIVDASDNTAPPVIFAPAANPIAPAGNAPIGSSERSILRDPANPAPVGGGTSRTPEVADETDEQEPRPKTPEGPSTPGDNTTDNDEDNDSDSSEGPVGNVTKPVTDLVDKVAPKVSKPVKDLTETVDEVAKPVTKVLEPVTTTLEPVTKPVEKVAEPVTKVAEPVTKVLEPVTKPVTGLLGGR